MIVHPQSLAYALRRSDLTQQQDNAFARPHFSTTKQIELANACHLFSSIKLTTLVDAYSPSDIILRLLLVSV